MRLHFIQCNRATFPRYHGKGIVRRAPAEAAPKSPPKGDLLFLEACHQLHRIPATLIAIFIRMPKRITRIDHLKR